MRWIKILDPQVLRQADFVHRIKVGRRRVCLIKSGSDFFATQITCPHAGADLSYGWCKEGNLVCPYHRHEFDLRTGEGKEGQGDYIDTYPVEVRPDGIYIGFRESWWKRLFGYKE